MLQMESLVNWSRGLLGNTAEVKQYKWMFHK
jgi:hypothetical protein